MNTCSKTTRRNSASAAGHRMTAQPARDAGELADHELDKAAGAGIIVLSKSGRPLAGTGAAGAPGLAAKSLNFT